MKIINVTKDDFNELKLNKNVPGIKNRRISPETVIYCEKEGSTYTGKVIIQKD